MEDIKTYYLVDENGDVILEFCMESENMQEVLDKINELEEDYI
ncbi:MAG: hypothetical protein ACRCX2_28745 [Paraclostridium sp.]